MLETNGFSNIGFWLVSQIFQPMDLLIIVKMVWTFNKTDASAKPTLDKYYNHWFYSMFKQRVDETHDCSTPELTDKKP